VGDLGRQTHDLPIVWQSFWAIGRGSFEMSRWKKERKKETAAKK